MLAASSSTTFCLRHVLDVSRRELVEEALRDLRRDGNRRGHRRDDPDLRLLPDSPLDELVVEQERALERRRRALVRLGEDADQDRPAGESGQGVAHPLGAGDRVVLEPALREAGDRVEVVLRAERDDEDVGVVRALVGRDVTGGGVDRSDPLLPELDARLHEVPVLQLHGRRLGLAEEDVELREPERERVVLVDQRDANLVGDRVGEPARELQPAEPGSEDHDVLHTSNPTPHERRGHR